MNYVLIVIGLIMCFGGIYLRKVWSAFLDLFWGALFSFIAILVLADLWDFDERMLALVLLSALICAIASAIYDKVCVFINSFLSTFL